MGYHFNLNKMPRSKVVFFHITMARGKKSNRRSRRRTSSKKKKLTIYGTPKAVRIMRAGGQPVNKISRLLYGDVVRLDPSTGSIASYAFRANSCFDPDYTSGGHQPYGFDEAMTFHTHFTVLGAKINVRPLATSGGNQGPMMWGIRKSGLLDISTFTSYSYLIEVPGNKPIKPISHIITRDRDNNYIRKTYSPKKDLNIKFPVDDDTLRGNSTSNPSEDYFFMLFALCPDAAVNPTYVDFEVRIEYIVSFNEPKVFAQS